MDDDIPTNDEQVRDDYHLESNDVDGEDSAIGEARMCEELTQMMKEVNGEHPKLKKRLIPMEKEDPHHASKSML
ncbi:hypothetical protein HAX54_043556 [Datura stramonium]|uniref:Uncharacterized protein n=1 Tax=Datura stramonium TaxID=4076 RepID=A0ABS8W169_DATST|nr:hypothetical protein [Datura stramonium]